MTDTSIKSHDSTDSIPHISPIVDSNILLDSLKEHFDLLNKES